MKIRHRRTAVLLAAAAVTGVTGLGIVAGTASAAGTGTCTQNVNVRSEPSKTAPVVGTCEKGATTRVGETRNGFVKLDEFGGWASKEYVKTGSTGTTAPNQAGSGTSGERSGTGSTGTGSTGTGSGSEGTGSGRSGAGAERSGATDSDSTGSGSTGSDSTGSGRSGSGLGPGSLTGS